MIDPNGMEGPSMLTGLAIFCLGLLLFFGSAITISQGSRVPSIIGLLLLGLALIGAGDQIYRRRKRKLINKRQVAEIFAVSQSTIDRWLQDGKLPKPTKFMGLRRWNSDEVTARLKFKRHLKGRNT